MKMRNDNTIEHLLFKPQTNLGVTASNEEIRS